MKNLYATLSALVLSVAVAAPATVLAQAEGECSSGFCGTPRENGGGGCGCGGSILINNTDLGDTYGTSDDYDTDGFEDDFDNCTFSSNRDQVDGDGDQVGDACDNAPTAPNLDQLDIDGDGKGDVIDDDIDGDNIQNVGDNCARVYNPTQRKTIAEAAMGDACNDDDDLDGIRDIEDACPKMRGTTNQGESCFGDEDGDAVLDELDNCPGLANDEQGDVNANGIGDACDFDIDGDGIPNNLDNAKMLANADQIDRDRDGLGDVADSEFCYAFDRAAFEASDKTCLNPLDTFKVGALAVGTIEQLADAEYKLVLFANRTDTPIEYTWTVSKAPDGSDATVRASVGKTVTSVPGSEGFEYAYAFDGNNVAPTFTPDVEGEYELKLVAKLVFADEMIPQGPQVATYTVRLTSAGGASSGGCSTQSGSATGASLLLVALGFIVMRRRRA